MKSKVVIAVVVSLIIVLILVLVLNKNNTKVIEDISGDITQTITNSNDKYLERINIDVEEGYTLIDKQNITSSSKLSVEAIAYKEVKEDTGIKTLVNVYLKNSDTEPINKNEPITIELFDKNYDLTHRFGGIIEAGSDITSGNMTIVKTQFLSSAGDNTYAVVSLKSDNKSKLDGWKPSGENDFWSAVQ